MLDTAVTEFQKATALDPSFAEAWTALGNAYSSAFAVSGRYGYDSARSEAMNALQRSLALNPDLAGTHAELAARLLLDGLEYGGCTGGTEARPGA